MNDQTIQSNKMIELTVHNDLRNLFYRDRFMNTIERCNDGEVIFIRASENILEAGCYRFFIENGINFDIYVNRHETDSITQAISAQTYTFPECFELLSALAEPGSYVLDVGAHIGSFSLWAASQGYEVLSVEAAPRNSALLNASVARNDYSNIRVISTAVGDSIGRTEFIDAGPYGLIDNDYLEGPTVSIEITTIDYLLQEMGWTEVSFIKMDIEGSEVATIRGMADLLSRDTSPIILCESNGHTLALFDKTPNHLMALLEQFGYQIYQIEARHLRPVQATDIQPEMCVDYLATKYTFDHIDGWCILPEMLLDERINRLFLSSTDPDKYVRAYVARILSTAEQTMLSDPRIRKILVYLTLDRETEVREAVRWWERDEQILRQLITEKDADIKQLRELMADYDRESKIKQQLVSAKDTEIQQLQKLITGYEQGRFIRLMRFLNQVWRRMA